MPKADRDHRRSPSLIQDRAPWDPPHGTFHELLERLARKRVILCLGPGGVGKTTFSAALATRLAMTGSRTLVCTVDPARRLAQALGVGQGAAQPSPIPTSALLDAGLPRDLPMEAAILDVAATMDRALAQECRDEGLREAIRSNVLYRMLVEDLEGAQMYAALAQLQDIADQDRWDHIVVDTPPTVHLQDLLVAPYRITHAVQSPFLRWLASSRTWTGRTGLAILALGRARLLRKAASVVGGRFLEQLSQFIGLISDLLPILEQRAERADHLLKDRDTGYVIVTIPNQDRVGETMRLAGELQSRGMGLTGLVLNRVSPFADQSALEDLRAELKTIEDRNEFAETSLHAHPGERRNDRGSRTEESMQEIPQVQSDQPRSPYAPPGSQRSADPDEIRAHCLRRLVQFAESLGGNENQTISELRIKLPGIPLLALPMLPEDITGLSGVAQVAELLDAKLWDHGLPGN